MLQVNFIMIYIILKISVLLKITKIFKCFLRSVKRLFFLKNKYLIFFTTNNHEKLQAGRR